MKGPNFKVIKVIRALQCYWTLVAWRVISNPKDKPRHFWLWDTELHIMAFSFPFFTERHGFQKLRNLPLSQKKNLKIKFMDLLECMVCTAVENSYIFAAWRAVLTKERNDINLERKQQGPLNKAFDTALQDKACAVMSLCKMS